MRIAVTYENGQIFQHFGHTETFKIYDVEEGKVVHSEVIDTNGSGHGALAGVLNALNADVLICGGIGGGAQTALAAAGIKLFGGVSGVVCFKRLLNQSVRKSLKTYKPTILGKERIANEKKRENHAIV